jgi:signal transduction histidine kinase
MGLPAILEPGSAFATGEADRGRSVSVTLLLSFTAVVLSFVAATWYGEHRAGEIEEAALSIRENAAPSIHRLANARTELRRLQLLVHRAVDDGVMSRHELEIQTGRALLGNEIAEYQQLPMYPRETSVWPSVARALDQLDMDVAAVIHALRRGDLAGARSSEDSLDESSERLAARLSQAIDANVAEASDLAAQIRHSRQRGTLWAVGLDSAGVLLAGFAATLALRVSRAHQRAVQAYREVAERRADELEIFAARMAHDVRTPLSAAGLAVEAIAQQGPANERTQRAIPRLRSAHKQIAKIVDGLLAFARAGARPEVNSSASIVDIAEEIATAMRPKADEIGADLVVRADSHAAVACTEGMVASALGNMVGNALTYVAGAPVRRVEIRVSDEDGQVKTTVSDTGPGLPPNVDPQSLFQPYVRGAGARGGGLGLGLATVKRIVEAHGGKLGVQSSAGGAHFWFTLPPARTAATKEPAHTLGT